MIHCRRVEVYDTSGAIVNQFDKAVEAAIHYNISESTLSYRIKRGGYYGGLKFVSSKLYDAHPKKEPGKKIEKHSLEYEANGRICLTPCPYKKDMKIGSVLCQECHSFHGIDRNEHTVKCSRKMI